MANGGRKLESGAELSSFHCSQARSPVSKPRPQTRRSSKTQSESFWPSDIQFGAAPVRVRVPLHFGAPHIPPFGRSCGPDYLQGRADSSPSSSTALGSAATSSSAHGSNEEERTTKEAAPTGRRTRRQALTPRAQSASSSRRPLQELRAPTPAPAGGRRHLPRLLT